MPMKSNLGKLARDLAPALDEATQQAADIGKRERDTRTPVDTSALLASGEVRRVDEAHYQIREGDGLPDARAAFTEFGTSQQAAQPHMGPAARVAGDALPKAGAAALRRAIKENAL
jgi:HK97 gp10 family phage protein